MTGLARIVAMTALVTGCSAPAAAQDGSIVAWGNNELGQCDVPEPNEDFIAVAGGGYHSLGLKYLLPPTGACCDDGACAVINEAACLALGGTYMGDDTDCNDADCPEPCPADITGDEIVYVLDLLEEFSAWGPCP